MALMQAATNRATGNEIAYRIAVLNVTKSTRRNVEQKKKENEIHFNPVVISSNTK